MDNYIRKVQIKSLFEIDNDISIVFDEGINCIFGVNGSGKTTVINLLVACLCCDLRILFSIPFEEVTISIAKANKVRSKILLRVTKTEEQISINIPAKKINIPFSFPQKVQWKLFGNINKNKNKMLVCEAIENYLSLTYVPLTRMHDQELYENPEGVDYYDEDAWPVHSSIIHTKRERGNIDQSTLMLVKIEAGFKEKYSEVSDTINKELNLLKNKIVSKILIDKDYVDETTEKAESIYENEKLTLEFLHEDVDVYHEKFRAANIDIPADKLNEHFYLMDEMIDSVVKSRKKIDKFKKGTSKKNKEKHNNAKREYYENFFKLYSFLPMFTRFFGIIDDITDTELKKDKLLNIFYSTEDMINEFLVNKTFHFTKSGGFEVICRNKKISIDLLSSGEKHMIALLGRVALSPQESAVFIADEPELSLHLAWQRKILPSISALSKQMQVIVATHSPAIIPENSKMIDLEECVK